MKPNESKHLRGAGWIAAGLLALTHLIPATAAETNSSSNIGLKLLVEGLGAPETLVSIPDGSGRLLACLESHPSNFIAYAQAYHGVAIKMRDVERFFDRFIIREEDVLRINSAADVAAALESARQLGFKTSTGEGKPLKPLGAASAPVIPPP